ncbi:MAG TPA: ABC transporter ATP-binding protein [Clostridia bacterium]|nr:ABC transporter ATP-binding protein [Clostridia bacterium]HRX42719.1 ABC transporter ATP-binding protein [Clostridia bacterium]
MKLNILPKKEKILKPDASIPQEELEYDPSNVITCENLVKIYKTKDTEVVALQGLDLDIKYGEMMAIIGNSGSGKSTLLNMIGGLDRPSAGKLIVNGVDLLRIRQSEITDYKKNTVGFVWQNNARNLIPYLSARQNVELPMVLAGRGNYRKRSGELLRLVGLEDRMNNRLRELSGGEQQRVAIAIAMANEPKILLADEPTGAVDTTTATQIFKALRRLNEETGVTVIIVTHDRGVAKRVDRVVAISDGKTSSEFIRKRSYSEELEELDRMSGVEDADTHEELVVIDRHGRLKLPEEYMENIGVGNNSRIKVDLDGEKIIIYKQPEDME